MPIMDKRFKCFLKKNKGTCIHCDSGVAETTSGQCIWCSYLFKPSGNKTVNYDRLTGGTNS